MVNVFIVNKLDTWSRDLNTYFTLKNCLFGFVKLTKNFDIGKYKYRGYGIGFDLHSSFSLPDGSIGKNDIIFGADLSPSVHIDTTLTAEAKYPINFTQSNIKFCLNLHYNESNSFYLSMLQKYINSKQMILKQKRISAAFRKYFKRFHSY